MIRTIRFGTACALLGLSAIALAGAACGDDDDDDTDTPAHTATTAATRPAGASPTSGGSAGPSVNVGDNVFAPASLTVKVGDKVTWTWAGSNPHSVVGRFDGQAVTSQTQSEGRFEFTFAKAGTFDYQCGVHGAAMSGKVVVQ